MFSSVIKVDRLSGVVSTVANPALAIVEAMRNPRAEVFLEVSKDDTAIAYGSGDVPVLATPRVVALAEEASVAAVHRRLLSGQTSVGVHLEIHHVKATAIGGEVVASSRLVDEEGKKLSFKFVVLEGEKQIAFGTHDRVIVERDRFLP